MILLLLFYCLLNGSITTSTVLLLTKLNKKFMVGWLLMFSTQIILHHCILPPKNTINICFVFNIKGKKGTFL